MKPSICRAAAQRPNMLAVYGPIEAYWNVCGPGNDRGGTPTPEDALDPLTASLIHLVLDLVPVRPMLADCAVGTTGGASSLIGLAHPRVHRVLAITDRTSLETERGLAALRGYLRSQPSGWPSFDVRPADDILGLLCAEPGVVIVFDVRRGDPGALEQVIGPWLEELPDALVLVIGMGRVGECAMTGAVLDFCAAHPGRELWLLRDLGELLASSNVAMVARAGHPWAHELVLQIQQRYAGDTPFLSLLRSVNQSALEAAQIDAEAIKNSPLSWAIMGELAELKQAADEAKEQASAASEALASALAELNAIIQALHEARVRERLLAHGPAPVSANLFTHVRRTLAPTVVGKAWRLSKRSTGKVRRTLAPTPVGMAWRLSRRAARWWPAQRADQATRTTVSSP